MGQERCAHRDLSEVGSFGRSSETWLLERSLQDKTRGGGATARQGLGREWRLSRQKRVQQQPCCARGIPQVVTAARLAQHFNPNGQDGVRYEPHSGTAGNRPQISSPP